MEQHNAACKVNTLLLHNVANKVVFGLISEVEYGSFIFITCSN
jgi:hypothetical protein